MEKCDVVPNEQLVMQTAHELAIALADTIKRVRQVVALKYKLDQQSSRVAMTKALIQSAVREMVTEASLEFDNRCDLEDRIYRAILYASVDEPTRECVQNCATQST
jgi:hypothetical protein